MGYSPRVRKELDMTKHSACMFILSTLCSVLERQWNLNQCGPVSYHRAFTLVGGHPQLIEKSQRGDISMQVTLRKGTELCKSQ